MSKVYSEATKKKAISLYCNKKKPMPIEQIIKVPGMPNAKTLRKWLADAKVPMRPHHQQVYPRAEILEILKKKSMTRAQIQEKYGCSKKYLSDLASGKIAPLKKKTSRL